MSERPYLNREHSDMYDRDPKFPMENTDNAGRISYFLKGFTQSESRRCTIRKISRSTAVVEFFSNVDLPDSINLDIPDAKIACLGCVKLNERRTSISQGMTCVTLRFLNLIAQEQVDSILQYGNPHLFMQKFGKPTMKIVMTK